MTAPSTTERKRATKAMPSPDQPDANALGCAAALLAWAAACFLMFRLTRSIYWIVLATPVVLFSATWVRTHVQRRALMTRIERELVANGIRCIVVTSNSPNWDDYIRTNWINIFGDRAKILNWSDRKGWNSTLEAELFRNFAFFGGRNFNPCVMVLRGRQKPGIYRFYYAFQQAKHGRTRYRDDLEKRMFEEIESGTTITTG